MVVCTEVIEHVRDWQSAVSGIKNVLRSEGILLVTTRSRGFPCHDYPADFWRYELGDMDELFGDLEIEALESDPLEPGVLMKARKPSHFRERALEDYGLYSIVTGTRRRRIGAHHLALFAIKRKILLRLVESMKYRFSQLTRR
jgi:SAM-dependent methyltransferase